MENKKVGWIILGMSVVMIILVLIFNFSLKNIVSETCTHGPECTMYDTMAMQFWISIVIILVIIAIGLFIMFSKPEQKTVIKKIQEKIKPKTIDKSKLDGQEKELIEILEKENGAIFQATLMEKLNVGKVGITRLLDKLEAKQLIERKRRGMNNIVVLKL
jgi:uncharacterized membrane protein